MKVFISHSSRDKWAARRISEDIQQRGCEVFLDEKDIKTGESIDSAIRKHLADCHDFLILLSPASVKSEWVLLELGGAMALDKKIVPILLYVGANEVPQIINLKLSRDINDIDRYYEELPTEKTPKKRQPKRRTPKKAPRRKRTAKGKPAFKIGDRVKIVSDTPNPAYTDSGMAVAFAPEMKEYLGEHGTVVKVIESRAVNLDVDNKSWVWSPMWLAPSET